MHALGTKERGALTGNGELRCLPQRHPTQQVPALSPCSPASPHPPGSSGGSPSAVLPSCCPARSRRWLSTCSRSRSFCSSRSAAVCRLLLTCRPMFSSWHSRREASAICSCSALSLSRGSWAGGHAQNLRTPSPRMVLNTPTPPAALGMPTPTPSTTLGTQHLPLCSGHHHHL